MRFVRRMPAWADMGGRREFFGPIAHSPSEPAFHERWEARVFGMTVFVQSLLGPNIDAARYAMEQLPREVYMSSYYRRWLGGLESELVATRIPRPGRGRGAPRRAGAGPRRQADLAAAARGDLGGAATDAAAEVPALVVAHVLPRIIGTVRPALSRQRFAVGERVRVRTRRRQATPASRVT